MLRNLFKFYFSFKGRVNRNDFNMSYMLPVFLLMIGMLALDYLREGDRIFTMHAGLLYTNLFSLITLVPCFALTCRRLHDLNYSGWWQALIYFVLIFACLTLGIAFAMAEHAQLNVGFLFFAVTGVVSLIVVCIPLIALCAKRGTIGPNKYGPDLLHNETVEIVQ